jgi:hypothetical protein
MKRALLVFGLFLFLVLVSCSEDSPTIDELTEEQLLFIEEYEYVTFNFSPTSSGGSLNEKWIEEVPIFLDGAITPEYRQMVAQEISELNEYITDGTELILVDALSEADVHLYLGDEEDIQGLWADMYSLISAGQFQGYAIYRRGGGAQIVNGRIWVKNSGMPIFRHELGHILGFGHASETYCDNDGPEVRSYMCSSLAKEYSSFDEAMIKMLYHPDILPGLTFDELRPEVERLLLNGEIEL